MMIRKLRLPDDAAAVGKLYAESWKHAYRGILPQAYLDGLCEEEWAQNLDREGRRSLVAELDGKLIGVSGYGESRTPAYAGQGEVYSIYFLPAYMGKGYGKALMDAVLAALRALGYREIFLWVLEENRRARSFYESVGFVFAGEVKNVEIGGETVREMRYMYEDGSPYDCEADFTNKEA